MRDLRPALVLSLAAAACTAPAEPSAPADAGLAPVSFPFGDDVVAERLARDPARTPRDFTAYEALFGVGRACAKGKGAFVIEERATRHEGVTLATAAPVPRVVFAACDGPASLFTVISTDPARALDDDPLARTPVEAMALDRTTGAYAFYVFREEGLERVLRDGDRVRTFFAPREGAVVARDDGPRCFSCHVAGAPIMASAADPWRSWVSTRAPDLVRAYGGETASILARVAPANDLEPLVRNAVRAMVFAQPTTTSMLRSVFCETELEWASTFDTIPLPVFFDPGAVAGSGIARPKVSGEPYPALFPIRGDVDRRIEELLVARAILSAETVRVVRLLDDRNDVFSKRRCDVLPRVLEGLPADAKAIDAHVRAVLHAEVAALDAPAASYARALLDAAPDAETKKAGYFDSVRARFHADVAALAAGDRHAIEARLAARRAAARAMFPGPAHPIPVEAVP